MSNKEMSKQGEVDMFRQFYFRLFHFLTSLLSTFLLFDISRVNHEKRELKHFYRVHFDSEKSLKMDVLSILTLSQGRLDCLSSETSHLIENSVG
jgi:hypothetical protein